jgi:dienelactone hydrolase
MSRERIGTVGVGIVLAWCGATCAAAPPGPGFHAGVRVSSPTRLDWTFVVTNRSLAEVPQGWLPDYDSKTQTYDLFVPARKGAKTPLPLILYLSPGKDSGSGKVFARLAQARGLLYAAPLNAGNDCPSRQRVRIILDVLDDVRRQFPVDPDRTYIAGFSGGGRIACEIAFALPELFGGVAPVCAGGFPRDESWLRQRVVERLSVALVTGQTDFNRGEVERLRGPFLKDVGVRARVWTVPGLGHQVPGEKPLGEAVRWLEEGLAKRQTLARKYPASRLLSTDDVSREALARALLAEGRKRVQGKGSLYAGLMQIKGVMQRWPDLEAGKEAQKVLEEFEEKKEKPWEADDLAEQRLYVAAQARALDRYASGPLDKQYVKMRETWLRQALELWQKVLADSPDSPAGKQAKKRIAELEKMLSKE